MVYWTNQRGFGFILLPFVRQTSLTFEAYLGGGSITTPKNNTIAIHSFGRKKRCKRKKTLGKFQIYLQTPIPIQRLPPPEELNLQQCPLHCFLSGNEMSMKRFWSIYFWCRMNWAHNPPKQKVYQKMYPKNICQKTSNVFVSNPTKSSFCGPRSESLQQTSFMRFIDVLHKRWGIEQNPTKKTRNMNLYRQIAIIKFPKHDWFGHFGD